MGKNLGTLLEALLFTRLGRLREVKEGLGLIQKRGTNLVPKRGLAFLLITLNGTLEERGLLFRRPRKGSLIPLLGDFSLRSYWQGRSQGLPKRRARERDWQDLEGEKDLYSVQRMGDINCHF